MPEQEEVSHAPVPVRSHLPICPLMAAGMSQFRVVPDPEKQGVAPAAWKRVVQVNVSTMAKAVRRKLGGEMCVVVFLCPF